MQILTEAGLMRSRVYQARARDEVVGFVPTMGSIHEGHLALVERSVRECDRTVVSIYVNPQQFDSAREAREYPGDRAQDEERLMELEVDWLFAPDHSEVYPAGDSTRVVVRNRLVDVMEGEYRENFFDGVTRVVAKLINMVPADRLYFGEKDLQQLLVIRQMVRDLRLPQEVRSVPVVRDEEQIALSSRNHKLDDKWRGRLAHLSQELLSLPDRSWKTADQLVGHLEDTAGRLSIELDYARVVSVPELTETTPTDHSAVVVVAGQVGPVRFKDNVPLHAGAIGDILEGT